MQQAGDRLLEVAPGLVTWVLLLAPAWVPLIFASNGAMAVAAVVLLFDVYWFVRSFTGIGGIWSTYFKMCRDMRPDWLSRFPPGAPPGEPPGPPSFPPPSRIPTYTPPHPPLG